MNKKRWRKTGLLLFFFVVCACFLFLTACNCSGEKKEPVSENETMPVLTPDETEPVTDSVPGGGQTQSGNGNEESAVYNDPYNMTDSGNDDRSTEIQNNPVTEDDVSESGPEGEEIYTHGDYELPEVSLDD